MAKLNTTLPVGNWNKNVKTEHWLVYKKFSIYDDHTGSEFMQLQTDLREAIGEARDILLEHRVPIQNVYTEEFMDHRNYGKTYGVALGFSCKEDLVMAKLVLKCDESS